MSIWISFEPPRGISILPLGGSFGISISLFLRWFFFISTSALLLLLLFLLSLSKKVEIFFLKFCVFFFFSSGQFPKTDGRDFNRKVCIFFVHLQNDGFLARFRFFSCIFLLQKFHQMIKSPIWVSVNDQKTSPAFLRI